MPDFYTYADGRSDRERYLQTKRALWLERSSFDSHWRELAQWVRPRRERFFVTDRNRGDRRNSQIIDLTATYALRTLQSGLQAGLTSPARPWFRLTTPDPTMAEFGPVRSWLHLVTRRMQIIFERSNLYNVLPVIYGDLGLFGTAAMGAFSDDAQLMRATAYPIGSYAHAVDARGRTSLFCREYELSVLQAVQEFGGESGRPLERGQEIDRTRFSTQVMTAWDRGNYTFPVKVCWYVTRNPDYDPDALDRRQFPYTSDYFEVEASPRHDVFLRRSGSREFPVMVPRWDVTAEDAYGSGCPGMDSLGDVKALQIEQKFKAKAIQKSVDPPLQAPSHLKTQKVSMLPADITWVDVREGQQGIRPVHETKFPVAEIVQDIRETQTRVRRAFYEDLFLMLQQSDSARGQQPLTAREVAERHEEKLVALGPVLERTNDELLDPLIDRVFQLMDDAGVIPPPPPELEGVTLGVKYLSMMAQAQQAIGIVANDRFLASVANVSSIWPEARHKVKALKVVGDYAAHLGVNPDLVRDDDEADVLIAQEAQAQQAAQQAAQSVEHAKATRDLANAPAGGDTALSRIMGTPSGAP